MLRRLGVGLGGGLLASIAGLSPVTAGADEIIVFGGLQTITTTTAAQRGMSGLSVEDRDLLCQEGGPIDPLGLAVGPGGTGNIDGQIQDQLAQVDPALRDEYVERRDSALRNAFERGRERLEAACEDPATQARLVTIVYSTCRMTMRDGMSMIDVRFPPGSGGGWMTFLDPVTFEAIEMPLNGMPGIENINFTDFLNQDTGYVQGTDSQTVTGPGQARDKEVAYNFGQSLTLAGGEYTFDFAFELNIARSLMGIAGSNGVGGAGISPEEQAQLEQFMQIAGSPKVTSNGTALIAPDAPGLDIVREFYKTFAAAMGADGAYLTGLYNHQLLADGLPIEIDQTTEMVMPGFMGMGGATETSQSEMEITSIIGPLSTDYAYCVDSIVPPEYTVSNPMSGETTAGTGTNDAGGAGGSAVAGGAGAAAGTAPDLAEAMSAVDEAMQNMTPEQRAAMAQAAGGLEALLGGLAGGTPGSAAAEATPGSAAPAVARASGPSLSSALMTDNLTQSAQNMLEALGYDPGNTDGEPSMETTIAISQFQAEQGVEATGEVTPQLLGMLAAAVDAL